MQITANFFKRLLVSAALIAGISPAAAADPVKLVRVIDGDTIKVIDHDVPVTIRLNYIDAPETKQPYGPEAKQYLENLLAGRTLYVFNGKKERYGRTLGDVYVEDDDAQIIGCLRALYVNREMVVQGLAWSYRHKNKEINAAEELARLMRRGLWLEPEPEAPWLYRKRNKHTVPKPQYLRNPLFPKNLHLVECDPIV